MNILKLHPDQSAQATAFITRLQADQTHQIAYFGNNEAEIAAAIQTFDPPYNVLLAYDDEHLVGLLGVDTDSETNRAWLYGPLVDTADWQCIADALYEEARSQNVIPAFVGDEEIFVDAANHNIAAFAARHHFTAGTPHANMRLEREAACSLPAVKPTAELTESQHPYFAFVHDALFPNAYYRGGQIIERLGQCDAVFVIPAPYVEDIPIGYIYTRIEPEATDGTIDFVGVAPDFRRQGIATRLIVTAVHWLFSFPEIEAVTLTVDGANTPALSLYCSLGFTHLQTLQAYRKCY